MVHPLLQGAMLLVQFTTTRWLLALTGSVGGTNIIRCDWSTNISTGSCIRSLDFDLLRILSSVV